MLTYRRKGLSGSVRGDRSWIAAGLLGSKHGFRVQDLWILSFRRASSRWPVVEKLRLSLVGRVGEDRDLDICSRVVDAETPGGSGSVQPEGTFQPFCADSLCQQLQFAVNGLCITDLHSCRPAAL